MDSLDELLADLHSATTSMKREQGAPSSHSSSSSSLPSQVYQASYYSQREAAELNNPSEPHPSGSFKVSPSHNSPASGDSPRSRSSIELLSPHREPAVQQYYPGEDAIYEPQNIVYRQTSVVNNGVKANAASPGPQAAVSPGVASPGGLRGTLGNNLNELDMLLQDLNSAQFMKEMQSKSPRGGSPAILSPGARVPPPTLPKPSRTPLSPIQQTGFPQLTNPNPGLSYPFNQSPAISANHSTAPLSPTSGAATKELDDLMESLTKFKMTPPAASPKPDEDEPSYAKVIKSPRTPNATSPSPYPSAQPGASPSPPSVTAKPPSELDNMLGSLETDMKGQGVSVDTKGACAACLKPIVGQVITALGQIWHPEHFCCESCRQELGTKSFFERDGRPYCEDCNQELFAPMCQRCSLPIIDKLVTAMDTTWHMACFVCEHCGRMLHDEEFHEREGLPYCRTDFFDMFAPKCGGCGEPIIDDFISTLDNHWHTYCFRCTECNTSLPGGSFYEHDGMPYCETHYYAKRGSLCAGCQKPITGRCITAMFKKFHPEHFVCAFCLKQLNKGTFKEQNDKPYCHPCFIKLFG